MLDLSSKALTALAPSPADVDAALNRLADALALADAASRVARPNGSTDVLAGLARAGCAGPDVRLCLLLLCANPWLAPDVAHQDLFLAFRIHGEANR